MEDETKLMNFSRRELRILYAGLIWNADLDVINCSDDEFDAIVDRIGEAAGIDPEVGIESADDDPKDEDDEGDLCECGREPHLCAIRDNGTTWRTAKNEGKAFMAANQPELGLLKELDTLLEQRGFAATHPYRVILIRMAEIDSDISKSGYRPVSDNEDRPPDGDDYNLLWDAILDEIKAASHHGAKAPNVPSMYAVYYKSPQELVYSLPAHSEEEARAKFNEGHEEEIIRIEKL